MLNVDTLAEAGMRRIIRVLVLSLRFGFRGVGDVSKLYLKFLITRDNQVLYQLCEQLEYCFFINIISRQSRERFLYRKGDDEQLSFYFAGIADYIDYLLIAKDSGVEIPSTYALAEVRYDEIDYYVVFCLAMDAHGNGEVMRMIEMPDCFLEQLTK